MLGKPFLLSRLLLLAPFMLLSACGGGGSGSSQPGRVITGNNTSSDVAWVANEFSPHEDYQGQCTSTDQYLTEKLWLRSYSNDTYLWYDEIPDPNPSSYSSVLDYFDILKTSARTDSGKLKDQFHFSMSSEEWQQLSVSGASVSYGFNFSINQEAGQARTILVTYSEPNSPAMVANVTRGAEILFVDGVSVALANDESSVAVLNDGLFPSSINHQSTFTIRDLGASDTREVTLTAETITSEPVPIVNTIETDNHTVGYLVFNDHIATAEKGLYDAVSTLQESNIDELIVDLRYNGGGYLALASQLAFMVGGEQTVNRTFEQIIFNDKHPNINPVTGQSLSPTPFYQQTFGFNSDYILAGVSLPTLNLSRVFVMTTADTCSASEAFINGLRGIGVEVIQIGSTTCGKPYGFYPADNCDTTYFTVQFKGINDNGFGDYADGFSPNTAPVFDTDIQGCPVDDDLAHVLGDMNEAMLSTALYYLDHQTCPEDMENRTVQALPKNFIQYQHAVKDNRPSSQFLSNKVMKR